MGVNSMNLNLKAMYYVDASELVYGIDFEVVTKTPFIEGEVERLYGVDNHSINYRLIKQLGLGVVKNNFMDDYYIYNVTRENIHDELIKLRIYYQITNPEYDDKQLEQLIFGNEDGIDYIVSLLDKESGCVLSQLVEIFKAKKGKVLPFQRR